MLITLIYGSTSTEQLNEGDLLVLLTQCKRNNDALGITGMLLYRNGSFLQVLEGEEQAVDALYEEIKADKRHQSVMTIFRRPLKQRQFSDWTMGFVDLEHLQPEDIDGFNDFLQQDITAAAFESNPSHAHSFLLSFKQALQ